MKWLQRSLFRRLLISYLLPLLIGFGVIGMVISQTTSSNITTSAEAELIRQAKVINAAIQDYTPAHIQLKEELEAYDHIFNKEILVFNQNGQIVAASTQEEVYVGKDIDAAIVDRILQGEIVIESLKVYETEQPGLSVLVPWGKENELHGGIVVNTPLSGIRESIQSIREIVLWSLIFALLICTLLVSVLSWSILRPLKRVEHASTEIALGNYGKRVNYTGLDEIGELVSSFNRMAKKLDMMDKERQAMEQRRDDFIANISHELRTPLTTMQGYLEALQDKLVTEEDARQRYYEIMYVESKYLNRLVDDLMDLIKLKNKKVMLDLYYIQVEEVLKKVILALEPKVKQNGNEILMNYPDHLPHILADSVRLEQIFINLIHNANKFTENGKIHIQISTKPNKVYIEITDNGMGIPAHDITKIWDRFYKASPSKSKSERGTGLGLAIVKELVELHHGRIHVTSELGKGSKFTIVLPVKPPG